MKKIKNNYKEFKNLVKSFDISKLYEIQEYLLKDKNFLSILENEIKYVDNKLNDFISVNEYNKIFIEFYNNVKLSYYDFKDNVLNDTVN